MTTDRVLVVGATGATGRRVVRELASAGITVIAAGRNQHVLDALQRTSTGSVETVVVDATHVGSVRAAMGDVRAVASCIGPYSRYGRATAEAAAREGVGYVDMTGEPAFVHRLIADLDPLARDTGAVLVPAVAAMGCTGDLAAAALVRAQNLIGPVDEITVGYRVEGFRPSAGSLRSAIEMIADGCPVYEDGWLTWVPAGANTRRLPGGRATTTVAPDPILINRWCPDARIECFLISPAAPAIALGSRLGARLMGHTGVRHAAARVAAAATKTHEVPAHGTFEVLVSARDRFGWHTAAVSGRDIYGFTARAGRQVIEQLLQGAGEPGVNAPSQVLGDPIKAIHSLRLDLRVELAPHGGGAPKVSGPSAEQEVGHV